MSSCRLINLEYWYKYIFMTIVLPEIVNFDEVHALSNYQMHSFTFSSLFHEGYQMFYEFSTVIIRIPLF